MKKRELKPAVAAAPPGNSELSLIPHGKLLAMYAAVLKCRLLARKRKGSRRISEAVAVGATVDLLPTDAICPAANDLTPCLVKGVALQPLWRWWSHRSQNDSAARVPAAFPRANVIAPNATTAARLEATLRLASHLKSAGSQSVAVFFTGTEVSPSKSADISHQEFASLMRTAATLRLPILFIRQSEAKSEDWIQLSEDSGVPGMVVDRDDVVAVYRVVFEALAHARYGNGPTLIECKPWRVEGRKRGAPRESDCIGKMELYIKSKGLDYRAVKRDTKKAFAAELLRAARG
jgi:hypothetical protein